jgi:hypothetical protein
MKSGRVLTALRWAIVLPTQLLDSMLKEFECCAVVLCYVEYNIERGVLFIQLKLGMVKALSGLN